MQEVRFAGFWIRFVASFIDHIIVSVGCLVLIVPLILVLGLSLESLESYGNDELDPAVVMAVLLGYGGVILISLLVNWLYFAFFEASSRQATIGKMAVGVRVVGPQGERISFARATGRTFGKVLSGLICYIGYIIAGFTEYKQALHDMMASTYVVYKDDTPVQSQPYQAPPPADGLS